ncbi:MAG: tRNA guanosine(34) transglycosylase Tgt [Proteobacteria bacterium]|nr:tRNA guanosine(34) transglycosylase Tgt [Pseudomonadota bacterium]
MTASFSYQQPSLTSRARLGRLVTPHGVIQTPAFIFCATKGAMKAVPIDQMKEAETQIILSNTYHLLIQPGADVIEKLGGLHRFIGWNGPMLTDSGGFQIFSLGHGSVADEIKGRRLQDSVSWRKRTLRNIREEGAIFKSYTDGRDHLLTPEKAIQVQRQLGADLIVVLDECTPFHVDKTYTRESMEMSHRWGIRSLEEFKRHDEGKQTLYGIVQGGVYPDLRQESCQFVNDHPFFGHAIGGSLGASKEQMYSVIDTCTRYLDPKRPIHLLGIGGIQDIFTNVEYGIDTFDCVHPTRLARHGGALVKPSSQENDKNSKEHINLRNARFREDPKPIEENCLCKTCQNFSRSYLHHLLKAKEILAYTLITIHNVYFMNQLMSAIRAGLAQGNLDTVKKEWVKE